MLKLLLNPKNWPFALGYCLFRPLLWLPYPMIMWLGKVLGLGIYRLAKTRRKIAMINISRCFPELSELAQKKLVKENFISMGKGIFETTLSFWASDRKLSGLLEVQGIEYYHQAIATNRGILLISGHFTTLELASRMGFSQSMGFNKEGHPTNMMYRQSNNPLLENLIQNGRKRYFKNMFPKNSVKSLMRALKQKQLVCYTPDQSFKRNTVFVPFFNIQTATTIATAKIIKATDAIGLPCFCVRKPQNKGYIIKFQPPLKDFPSGDDVADITKVSQLVEQAVREAPDQYLWAHRRFKLRPEGEPDFYKELARNYSQ